MEIPKLPPDMEFKGASFLSSAHLTETNHIVRKGHFPKKQSEADSLPLRDASQGPVGNRMGEGGGWTSAAQLTVKARLPRESDQRFLPACPGSQPVCPVFRYCILPTFGAQLPLLYEMTVIGDRT